ncbi:MAG: flippase [Lachnospiraceae bacterium]|nr:flippase [Lachnospiraceae bacterium]
MKQKHLTANYAWNFVGVLLGFLFPVLSFMYVSRIIGVDGLGKVEYSFAIVNMAIVVSRLGIQTYAIGKASGYRDDRAQLSRFFSEILTISFVTTLLVEIGFLIIVFLTPAFAPYRYLLCIGSANVVLSTLGIPWLYSALEEFRYITLRQLAFQILSILLLLLLVRDENDVVAYAVVSVFAMSAPGIVNLLHAGKYVDYHLRGLSIGQHWKPILILFLFHASSSIYANSDKIMLGYIKGEASVGYYAAAIKIAAVVTEVLAVVRTTVLPRSAYYLLHQEETKYRKLLNSTVGLITMLSVPACTFLFVLSEDLILIFSGAEFRAAAPAGRILALMILFGPLNGMLVQNIFVIHGREKTAAIISGAGAVVNIVLNLFLLAPYGAKAAAATTVLSEIVVLALILVFSKSKNIFAGMFGEIWKYSCGAILIAICWIFYRNFALPPFLRVSSFGILGGSAYLVLMIALQESHMKQGVKIIRDKFFPKM